MKREIVLIVFSILLIGFISAANLVCCEKMVLDNGDGLLRHAGEFSCQNAPEEQCDPNSQIAETSCESTTFCQLGTCIDSDNGDCIENTPRSNCDGIWKEESINDLNQCKPGCCLIGDQASFVTNAQCKSLSSLYGLAIDYRSDIQNEFNCISSAKSKVKGACVYEETYERTCRFLTKNDCTDLETRTEGDVHFYAEFLCTHEDLNTDCAPSDITSCIDGKDEVYFLDTCGNPANIYDSQYAPSEGNGDGYRNYWNVVSDPECGYGKGTANCGNCDYLEGSVCKKYDRSFGGSSPDVGDYICKSLDCKYDNDGDEKDEDYDHGESWCAGGNSLAELNVVDGNIAFDPNYGFDDNEVSKKNEVYDGANLPGSRYYRLSCYNGEIIPEACADYRQEVCLQSSVEVGNGDDFSNAACRVNKWEDCIGQDNEADCENTDKRDCYWMEHDGVKNFGINSEEPSVAVERDNDYGSSYSCVPKYAPGYNFWNEEADDTSLCHLGTHTCVVTNIWSMRNWGWGCDENCECKEDDYDSKMNRICASLGDCGVKKNIFGEIGFNKVEDLFIKTSNPDEIDSEDEEDEE